MEYLEKKSKQSVFPFVLMGSSLIFYFISFYNYLLFHSLVEIFTIIIAFALFSITWASRDYVKNDFLLIIGVTYFFVGLLDLLHTLTYKGIGIIPEISANIPTQLWIATRYLAAISFLAAFFILGKKVKGEIKENIKKIIILFSACSVITVLILFSIFFWKIFPDAFIEGTGLTPFKKISEYIISSIFFITILLLYKKKKNLPREMASLIFFSLVTNIAAEMFFTDYASVYGFSNMLGHILIFMSFLFLYKAFIDFGLKQPYQFLFRDLKKREESLRYQASFPMISPSPILEMDSSGKAIFLNPKAREIIQNQGDKGDYNVFFPDGKKYLLKKLARGEKTSEYYEIKIGDRFFGVNAYTIPKLQVIRTYAFDITEHRHAEEKLKKSQMELQGRVEENLVEAYEQLGIANRKISLLLEIREHADEKSDRKQIINYIMNAASSACHAKIAMLYRHEENGELSLVSGKGFKKEELNRYRSIAIDDIPFIKKLIEEKRRINSPCRLEDVGSFGICEKLNYFVAVPFVLANRFKGFIFLGFKRRKSMDSHELEFLDVFSIHAATALAKIKIIRT